MMNSSIDNWIKWFKGSRPKRYTHSSASRDTLNVSNEDSLHRLDKSDRLQGSLLLQGTIGAIAIGLLMGCQPQPTPSQPDSAKPTRSIEHAMGTSEIPATPQRVVVLDTAPLDTALALGIQPVGTITYGTIPDYLEEEDIKDIAVIGDGNQPNLEAILQLDPDLILGSKVSYSRQQYQLLSQIAPTVFTEGSGRENDWQQNFELYAKALGKSELAEQLIESYQQQIQQLRQKLSRPQTLEISALIVYSDRVVTYTTKSFSGSVLQDIGLARPPSQDITRTYALDFSVEAFDELDGDYIFLIYSPDFPSAALQKEEFITNPRWSQLKAVRQDQVCEVTGAVWTAGRSFLAANQILTDLEKCLIRAN